MYCAIYLLQGHNFRREMESKKVCCCRTLGFSIQLLLLLIIRPENTVYLLVFIYK